ncbi:MAG: hypothetical protein EZS28_046593, partial [Streblomastix strix]
MIQLKDVKEFGRTFLASIACMMLDFTQSSNWGEDMDADDPEQFIDQGIYAIDIFVEEMGANYAFPILFDLTSKLACSKNSKERVVGLMMLSAGIENSAMYIKKKQAVQPILQLIGNVLQFDREPSSLVSRIPIIMIPIHSNIICFPILLQLQVIPELTSVKT